MSEHYFTPAPTSAQDMAEVSVVLGGRVHQLLTAGGVFSPAGLDRGTAVLLRTAPPPPPEGHLLDLGCGWGPVALDLAMRSPGATVWALDVNRRALDLTRRNAERLGVAERVRTVVAEDIPAEVTFSAIRSNPPIHVGKRLLHELLQTWLPRLAPDGVAHLVVQRHLGSDSLHAWLTATFPGLETTRLASSGGFRVLAVRRPTSP